MSEEITPNELTARKIEIEQHVQAIKMPDNLAIALMVAKHRKNCNDEGCPFDYYAFAFGQSPFHVPPPLVKALGKSAEKGHYSDAEGIPQLREAVAGFNKRWFGIDADPDRIVIGPGTKDLIHLIFDIVSGGAILPSPSWIGYSPQIKLLEKHFHILHLNPDNDYKIEPSQLHDFAKQFSGEQHVMVINNPHNPTGVVYSRGELEEIADVCRVNNILVIADEIYAITTYNFDDFTSMGVVYPEGSFVTNGLSKDRSSGGYRLGSCILPEKCSKKDSDAFKKVAATIYTYVSTPTQFAAIDVYNPNDEIDEYFEITRNIHRIIGTHLSAEFGKIDGLKVTTPHGGFYFFVDFNELKDDLKRKDVPDSNALGHSLIDHPFHFACVTGDACLLDPDDYGARIAFVDYNGKQAYDNYKADPPSNEAEDIEFVKKNAPKMLNGIESLKKWVEFIRS